MGRVEIMQPQKQERLLAYLQRHAMQPVERQATADTDQAVTSWLTRIGVLLPFLLMTGLGLLRWWLGGAEVKPDHPQRYFRHVLRGSTSTSGEKDHAR